MCKVTYSGPDPFESRGIKTSLLSQPAIGLGRRSRGRRSPADCVPASLSDLSLICYSCGKNGPFPRSLVALFFFTGATMRLEIVKNRPHSHLARYDRSSPTGSSPGLFMNLLLRLPIVVKTQRVLLPGARRTGKYDCAPARARHTVFYRISSWRRTFMNSPG